MNLGQFVSAIRALGYIEGESSKIDDEALVISHTRNNSENQLVRDFFHWGDRDTDGLIDVDEFLDMVREMNTGD